MCLKNTETSLTYNIKREFKKNLVKDFFDIKIEDYLAGIVFKD